MMTLNESGLRFIPEIHYYESADGKPLLSVTELLRKHGLGRDFKGISKEVLEKAAERGTAIHKLIEDYDNGVTEFDSPYLEDLVSYLGLKREKGFTVERSEYMVCNDIAAGAIDKVLSDGSIADVKTCSALDREALDAYRWQLSVYKYLFETLNPGMTVPHLYIIWVRGSKNKLVDVPPVPREEIEHLFDCERRSTPEAPVRYEPLTEFTEKPRSGLSEDKLRRYVELEREIAGLDETVKALKAQRDALGLCDDMVSGHQPFAVYGDARITLVEGQIRTSVDSKKLKDNYPDLYSEVTRSSEVKPFLKITFTKA